MTNYGWNMGDWYVWGGWPTARANRGAFGVNRSRRLAEFTDGLSNTMVASEVKTYQPFLTTATSRRSRSPASIPAPTADPYAVVPEYRSGSCALRLTGHTEWVDGAALETGFTTAWTPNQEDPGGADLASTSNILGRREKTGGPTFAAITARSYHPGGVNALFGDGSVRFIKDTIDGATWRSLGSVQSGEVVSSDAY